MRRLLTWRVLLLVVPALVVTPYLASPVVTNVMLVMITVPAIVAAVRAYSTTPRGRLLLGALGTAEAMCLIEVFDRLVHDGSAGMVAVVAGVLSVVAYIVALLAILRARRPASYHHGVFDGLAALAGMVAVQWQWSALRGAASAEAIAATTTPFTGALCLLAVIMVFRDIGRDPTQPRAVLAALVLGPVTLVVGAAGSATFTRADAPAWSLACYMVGTYLFMGAMAHPALHRILETEPERRRLIEMRWVGPACALVATPIMMVMFVVHGKVPTAGIGLVCCALTGVALWRGNRLIRDQERSRRELIAEQRFRSLVQHATDAILVMDRDRRVMYASGGVEALFGTDAASLEGVGIPTLVGEDDTALVVGALDALDENGVSAKLARDVCLRRSDGQLRWVSVSVTNHCLTPHLAGWVVNLHDVTDRKHAEEALTELAMHDRLTGLPNRASLVERLGSALADGNGAAALLFCDLDGFKAVNDVLGHQSGDDVLRAVAGRWSALLRSDDVLGRWGGDEFLMVCRDVPSLAAAEDIAGRLVEALRDPVLLPSGPAQLGVSVGVALHLPGESADAMIARADAAMYAAKRRQGGGVFISA